MKQHIQFFYLKTGNGHLAPAKAIAKNLSQNYGDSASCELIDGLEESNTVARSIIEDGYARSVNNAVWVFEALYALHKILFVAHLSALLVSWFVKPYLRRCIQKSDPDKLVVLHFFLLKPLTELVKELELDIPIVTVVTDPFTAHPIWFLDKSLQFVVFSEQLKNDAIRKGVPRDNIVVYPFILDEAHSNRMTDVEILRTKEKFGFSADKKMILIIGGGDGIPKGAAIAESIRLIQSDAEIAFVCGRNERLRQKVQRVKEKYQLNNLKVFGYVDFVHSLLNISDVVVTKCGASTFMEILMAQKIPVISNYIWEQEKGNMEFVRDNRMGVYEKRVHKLPMLLDQLVSNTKLHRTFVDNILLQNLRSGTEDVSQYILRAGVSPRIS